MWKISYPPANGASQVNYKLMRMPSTNCDLLIVECRLAFDECRLPLIVDHKAFKRRRLIEHHCRLFHDYNRPCMHLHLIMSINRKMIRADKYTYKIDQFSSFYD